MCRCDKSSITCLACLSNPYPRRFCGMLVTQEVLTESGDVPGRDDAGGESKESFVDVVAAFTSDA